MIFFYQNFYKRVFTVMIYFYCLGASEYVILILLLLLSIPTSFFDTTQNDFNQFYIFFFFYFYQRIKILNDKLNKNIIF